ncbi:MAG: AMP-binding protein [Peptostreptococcus sp.]|uniref:(2,3-dihydroxybenzoyl)adenylate synthase n=1 Tax=Peptostreptococcus sp. TaxID=1262 RepID=UPI0007643525|nr:AMP-binding protein [Peptostreptococcus sp.]KWZ94691.1 putativeadenylate synthase [Anaerococcus hydrogenalis]MDU5350752.1 AMP-binding protein [Peptostreptococcus sp.]MDU5890372.1 AMP-binding protein [Peptostreptococcus sp.]HEO7045735.1 AMP-binding protein [Streptococcus agalactiae]
MNIKDKNDIDKINIEDWINSSIVDELLKKCKIYGDKIAVIDGEKSLSYKELSEKIIDTAHGFLNSGLNKGDRVIIQLPNGINFVLSFFGLLLIGVIPILALPAHRRIELKGIIKSAHPVGYIYQDTFMGFDYSDLAESLCEEFKFLDNKYCVEHNNLIVQDLNINAYQEFPEVSGEDIAFLSLSGGTTGIPKLIPRTHADYLYDTRMSIKRSELTKNDVYLALLPMGHNFILGHPGFIGTLLEGSKLILNEYVDINEGIELIEIHKVSILALVPSMVKLMIEIQEDEKHDISSLRVIQVGGAFFEESISKKLIEIGEFKLQQVFGVAEGLNTMTSLKDDKETIITTQGKPISSYDVIKIVDECGNELPFDEYGELLIKGPYTINSYYNNVHNIGKFTNAGFYRTGDRAKIDRDGNLKIAGRIYEMINKSGEKITPSEIEDYLSEDEAIKDCAVVGLPDQNQGEIICAFIISDLNINLDYVRKYLMNKKIAQYKLPDRVFLIDMFPLTNVGKVNKKELIRIGKELMKNEY